MPLEAFAGANCPIGHQTMSIAADRQARGLPLDAHAHGLSPDSMSIDVSPLPGGRGIRRSRHGPSTEPRARRLATFDIPPTANGSSALR
jgi:hypothetical protein